MHHITLTRSPSSEQGTLGRLQSPGLSLFSLELPWRNNQRAISCIPCGHYICSPYFSAKFKHVYLVQSVQNRSAILIHAGNFAGDTRTGLKSHSQGCILLGKATGYMQKQLAVFNSQAALRNLREYTNNQAFTLHIIEGTV